MTGRCDTCGQPVELLEHRFFEGVMDGHGGPTAGARVWYVTAALYHLGSRNFCGPACVRAGSDAAQLGAIGIVQV